MRPTFYMKKGLNNWYLGGFKIVEIVSDRRNGLTQYFEAISVQMIQFYKVAIIRRHIYKESETISIY
jgi:hypothetical protein